MRKITGLKAAAFLSGCLLFFLHSPLQAEQEKDILFFLSVDSSCASLVDDARLSEAIKTRIPHAFIIRGMDGNAKADWSVIWKPKDDTRCEVLIHGPASDPPPIALGPQASAKDIESAASQIAWISTFVEEKKTVKTLVEKENNEEKKAEPERKKTEEVQPKDHPKEKTQVVNNAKDGPKTKKKADVIQVPPPKMVRKEPFSFNDPVVLSLSVVPGLEYHIQDAPRNRPVPTFALNLFGGSHIGLRGLEMGLIWNHKTEFVKGVQMAGVLNMVEGPLQGMQLALVNIAGGQSDGMQLGIGNIASDLNGLQLGIVNVGGLTKYQIGLINIAEISDLSLGVFNLNWGRSIHPTLWYDSENDLTVGLEHGSRYLKYSILFSYFFNQEGALQLGGGLGWHGGEGFLFSIDLFAYELLFIGDSLEKLSLNMQIKMSAGYRFSERLSVFTGFTVNGLISGIPRALLFFPDAAVIELDPSRDLFLWPGLHFGATF